MPDILPSLPGSGANAHCSPLQIDKVASSSLSENSATHLPSPLPSPVEPRAVPESNGVQAVKLLSDGADPPKATGSPMGDAVKKKFQSLPTGTSRTTTLTNGVRRLSASKMAELADSLPIAALPNTETPDGRIWLIPDDTSSHLEVGATGDVQLSALESASRRRAAGTGRSSAAHGSEADEGPLQHLIGGTTVPHIQEHQNSTDSLHTVSRLPASQRKLAESLPTAPQPTSKYAAEHRHSHHADPRPPTLHIDNSNGETFTTASLRSATVQPQKADTPSHAEFRATSPMPPSIPLPPMSLPTLLQLELAGQRPSPLYIYHSHTSDIPYESNAVKFERLKNFLLLPTYLERTMYFGTLACLDAWLWTLTILPIRFCIAASILIGWWASVFWTEVRWLPAYVWRGLGRMWQRGRSSPSHRVGAKPNLDSALSDPQNPERDSIPTFSNGASTNTGLPRTSNRKIWSHRRTKSMPSDLTPYHKADLLQGAVIVCSSIALMNLDASRMYHFIRAQSAVKLYVIYNLVEVGDRLLSAVGQDVFECLFSSETLSRTSSGRSKILLPFGMFCLSLVYNIAHSIVLFYQVITLNVAINSYSNALLSLLMSNQFVEVKSSVFKRTEKENTFQLACADIVERFQLWIVLFIIAMRNVVEIGGLSVPGAGAGIDFGTEEAPAKVPLHNASILPASFTILPSWLVSVEVLSPFLIVIGSEMIVDWIKHGYINKFNNIKPNFYSRILDILCKDYYTNAFLAPTLIRRLGLPLIPLCTLFVRSSVQTYHMFLATHLPSPLPPSTHTSLAVESAAPSSPAIAASLERLDLLIRNALGRAVHGNPYSIPGDATAATLTNSWLWSSDDVIAGVTMVVVFFIMFLILLIAKLLLGMALLRYARNRYTAMKVKEHAEATGKIHSESFEATGKRTGGFGKVEVGDDRRRWIFQDDAEGLKKLRDKEQAASSKGKKEIDLNTITRYEMVAKRIW